MQGRKQKNISLFIILAVNSLLIVFAFYLFNYVNGLIKVDIKDTLNEIAYQNTEVIKNRLMNELNQINLSAVQISERYTHANQDLFEVFTTYANEKEDNHLYIADQTGLAIFRDGSTTNIKGRQYYQLSLEGKANISERVISRLTGEEIFVISAPIINQNITIGTIQKQYTLEEMYELCSASLFAEKGELFIINSEGYILIDSQQKAYSSEYDNFFRMIYVDNPEMSDKLQYDIKNNTNGYMEIKLNDEDRNAVYTNIEGIYDWYLISSISNKAVLPNSHIIIQMFLVSMVGILVLISLSMMYYLEIRKKQQKKIENFAFVDSVTKGNSYSKFLYDISFIMNKEKEYYIVYLDVDNFKYINTIYGFDAGNSILKGIYQKLQSILNVHETCARVYGDQFIVLIEKNNLSLLENLFKTGIVIQDIVVNVYAGVYPFQDRTENMSLIMDRAKLAIKQIKGKHNKHIEIYTEHMDQAMIQNESVKRQVEEALQKHEIIPYYQPKVNILTNEIIGAEALARWKKDGQLIAPSYFIPVCEHSGLIVEIDMSIFEQTVQFIKKQLNQKIQCVPISVNFSRLHFSNPDFVHKLQDILDKYDVPSSLINIEITESVIFDNLNIIKECVDHLHLHNIEVEMDDFGAGFSSLNSLKDINIDVLKIDQGFLHNTEKNEKQKIIFESIANMASKLKMKVVVEGVETKENVELMKDAKCAIAQGYFFSKPVSEDIFEGWYKKGKIV